MQRPASVGRITRYRDRGFGFSRSIGDRLKIPLARRKVSISSLEAEGIHKFRIGDLNWPAYLGRNGTSRRRHSEESAKRKTDSLHIHHQ